MCSLTDYIHTMIIVIIVIVTLWHMDNSYVVSMLCNK